MIPHLIRQGEKIIQGVQSLIHQTGLGHVLEIGGHPSWSFLQIRETPAYSAWEIKTLFLQEMFVRGILTLGTHNMSYAHSDLEVTALLEVYAQVFPLLKQAVDQHKLEQYLRCQPLEPLFKGISRS